MGCNYFEVEELVSPEILAVLTPEMAWRLIPAGVQVGLDTLRKLYGAAIAINGRGNTQCGVRALNCATGAKLSGHKGYRGETCFDLHAADLGKLEMLIRKHWKVLGISRIENPAKTVGWRHITFGELKNELEVFDP